MSDRKTATPDDGIDSESVEAQEDKQEVEERQERIEDRKEKLDVADTDI